MVELIWEGKYDEKGNRVSPLRVKLPFQTSETINASAKQRQMLLDFSPSGKPQGWFNRLIWGDKKYTLPSLLDEFAGKIDLIYIDPPFNIGADFSYKATIPDFAGGESSEISEFAKQPSILEQKAYRDTWAKGKESYIKWLTDSLGLLFELMSEKGCLYLHLDNTVGHYAKVVMDEIFGEENFINQIIWRKVRVSKAQTTGFGNVHDIIFLYAKSKDLLFNEQFTAYDDSYIKSHYNLVEENTGRSYGLWDFTQSGNGPARRFFDKRIDPPPGKHWIWSQKRIDDGIEKGRIVLTSNGTPRLKRYLDEAKGRRVSDLWSDIFDINSMAKERLGYPTQKPETLLERIISASSNEGDLVLDCFCGSGTTAAVAEKLDRRWIACDLSRFAIHTTRKRLLNNQKVKPFVIQNLGKYERQTWQAVEFGGKKNAEILQKEYRNFILQLFSSRPVDGYSWLHGINNGRMVHVGSVDSPISPNDVSQIAIEFKKAMGSGKNAPKTAAVDILGWDFAFEVNEVSKQQAAEANIDVRFLRIPRDVMDPKAVKQGDIHFFELAALSIKPTKNKRELTLELTDFVIPPDDVPEDVQKAISHWSQWIDYWAVDWENREDTFHNQWQTYRTREDHKLKIKSSHVYEEPGDYVVMVKVIDILGNDTTKTLTVSIK